MIAQILAGSIKLLCGCNARWIDCVPEDRSRIYYANHTSHLDAAIIWASLPGPIRNRCRMVAARDYWTARPMRRFIARNLFNVLLIDRDRIRKSRNPITAMQHALHEGCSLILFPEGGRQTDAGIGPFRSGLFHLARRAPHIELVPVYLENLNRVMPKGETLPVPFLNSITFGSPFHLKEGMSKEAFLEYAQSALGSLRIQ